MALAKVSFKPGIDREGTQYSAGPTWYDCDKVRFRKGRAEKIGGWVKFSDNTFKGVARSLLDWGTAGSAKYLGIGTSLKFYVEAGGVFFDITPIRSTTAVGGATFDATTGSATIVVTDSAHGAALNDYVTFSGSATLGGNITANVLNQEYAISKILSSSTYEIEAKNPTTGDPVLANASDTGNGGASVVAEYQINTGTNTFVPAVGYGAGSYGSSPWGGGGALSFAGQLRLYSQDSFADDLIFCARGGGVFFWDESESDTDSSVIERAFPLTSLPTASDAPVVALQVMVSPVDRHVICFGVNPLGGSSIDPLLVRWSDQEDAGNWTPTATNSAGGQVLATGTTIIGAIRTRQEILIFTDTSIHAMRYAGAPFVYQFSVLAENISIASPTAAISVGDAVFFMDLEGFYIYDGAVRQLDCTVLNYVFDSIDRSQLFKVYAHNNPDDSEVTWHYAAGSFNSEVNRYVTYNYADGSWAIGSLDRGAWIQAPSRSYPIASSNNVEDIMHNCLYNHEIGYDADGEELVGWIESGELAIGDGESLAFMRRLIPDFHFTGTENNARMLVSIKGNDFPLDDLPVLASAEVTAATKQNHVRARAREIVMRIESTGVGYGWTMGDFRFDLRTDGKR